MNTPAGCAFFLHPTVNSSIKQILNAWTTYLESSASAYILSSSLRGWLNPEALQTMAAVVNSALPLSSQQPEHTFDSAYDCDRSSSTLGFASWDSFFTRRFRPGVRPVPSQTSTHIISNPCESQPYALQHNLQPTSSRNISIKSQSYNLGTLFENDPKLVPLFTGSTIYQSFLSALSYHRWHAPISGTVTHIKHVSGSYFAAHPSAGFSAHTTTNQQGASLKFLRPRTPLENPDPASPDRSQIYLTSVATRTIIVIFSPALNAHVAFVAVGMAECSSCVVADSVEVGHEVERGQEIGLFRYGGSSCCLILEAGLARRVRWSEDVERMVGGDEETPGDGVKNGDAEERLVGRKTNLKVCSELARVRQ